MTTQPAPDIRFWRAGGPVMYSAQKGSHADLVGDWLTSDIQGNGWSFVVLLDAIARLRSGETDTPYEASGNAWVAQVTKDHVDIENKYVDHEYLNGIVPLDTVLGVLRAYENALGESAIEEGTTQFVNSEHRPPRRPW